MNDTMDNDDIKQPTPELIALLENQPKLIAALQQIQLTNPNLTISDHKDLSQAILNSVESYDVLAQAFLLEYINEP